MRTSSARGRVLAGLAVVAGLGGVGASTAQAAGPIYEDRGYSFRERATDLVSRMSLAEKASQMNSSRAPGIARLGVRPYGWWNEALHGVARYTYEDNKNPLIVQNTTAYPISQSLGSSWDPDLMHRVASAIGDEARETAPDNELNLDFYSPTMNLERDPRWGRNDESVSEDPLLTSEIIDQFVDGMEGKGQDGRLPASAKGYAKTLTTIKHYAANNSEVNRLRGSSNMDDRTLREYYTKAFRDVIRDADPGSIMSSYNRVNGTPATVDPYLLSDLLRKTFGFSGYVTSDCDAIFEVTSGHQWQAPNLDRAVNPTERHAYALTAGTDLDCNKGYSDAYNFANQLPGAVMSELPTLFDKLNVGDVDQALVRLFTARMELGEFDPDSEVPWVGQARAAVPQGTWTPGDENGARTQTPARLALAREAAAKSLVLLKNTGNLLPLQVPATGAYRVLVVGALADPTATPLSKGYLGGYSADQGPAGQRNIINGYQGLREAVLARNPGATVDFQRGFTGTATDSAALTTIDQTAIDAARNGGYDAVIAYTGTDGDTANEDADRTAITLPGAQGELIAQLSAANPRTIAYMETIGPMDVRPFIDQVPALLWSSYNGQRRGEALADVVLGRTSPSGRLPSTWVQSVDQLPPVTDYNIRPTNGRPGRTYQYYTGPKQFPFGYGLSYTSFTYSAPRVSSTSVDANDTVAVSFDVTNAGRVAGEDTPQLYVSTPDGDASRPVKRLVGFRKVALAGQASTAVEMRVPVRELAFYDQAAHKWVVDPGRYRFQLARSADDVVASRDVTVSGTIAPQPSVVTADPAMAGDDERDVTTRVSFPVGAEIAPRLTVALVDDTLVGYVRKGESAALPAGMTVAMRSNRPGVVAVEGDRLKAVGPGIATITADVTDAGVTRSTTFVVRVGAQLTSLTVGGQELAATAPGEAFDPQKYDYDVVLAPETAGAPVVAATSGDPGATVDVTQASSVPGVATVRVSGSDGVDYAYRVHVARPARGDDFATGRIGSQWQVVRPDPSKTPAARGAYRIIPDTGTLAGTTNTAQNLLVQPASGDWTLQSRVAFTQAPTVAGQQAGLIAYAGDDDYVKLAWELSGNPGAARLTVVSEESRSGAPIAQTLANLPTAGIVAAGTQNRTIYLRLAKRGTRYTASYSVDGQNYARLYELGASLRDVRVGAYGYAGPTGQATPDFEVAFQGLEVTNAGPAAPQPEPEPGPGTTPTTPTTTVTTPGTTVTTPGTTVTTPGTTVTTPGAPGSPGAPGAPGAPAPAPGTAPKPRPTIAAGGLRADGRGRVAVKVKCAATQGTRCKAIVRLTLRGRTIGRVAVDVPAGRTTTVRVPLSAAARRSLAGRKAQRVVVRLQTRERTPLKVSRTTTLRVPR